MSISKEIAEMLKEHGISEDRYNEAREQSGLDANDYDDIALEYNAPLGKSWDEMVVRYKYEAVTENYSKTLNEQLDDLTQRVDDLGNAKAYKYLKSVPRNVEWEDLPSEMQDMIWLIAYQLSDEYMEKEGKSGLELSIKEIREEKLTTLLEEIKDTEDRLVQLKTKLHNPEFETIEDCMREMIKRTNMGQFDSYADSFRWAMEHCTITNSPKNCPNGKIENFRQCEKARDRLNSKGDYIPLTDRLKKSLEQ